MAKKKNKNLGKYSLFAVLFFTVVAIVMAFLANVKYTPAILDAYTVSGFKVMFGWKETIGDATIEYSTFSFMALLTYLLPIIGLISVFLIKKSKLLSLVPLACFIAGAILCFLMTKFVILTDAGAIKTVTSEVSLGFGAIIAGIMNILSALAVAVRILLS